MKRVSVVWTVVFLLMSAGASGLTAQPVELISRIAAVPDVAGRSKAPALSADGRWIAFLSTAPNLVPGQVDEGLSRNHYDTFLHDRVTGTTILVSHAAGSPHRAGRQVAAAQLFYADPSPAISADGRYVAFVSSAVDLIPGGSGSEERSQVFLYDRVTGTNTLVSHAAGSATTPADGESYGVQISADGNYVAFTSSARNLMAGQSEDSFSANVFLWSRASDTAALVSRRSGTTTVGANSESRAIGISADGDALLFTSRAADLLPPVSDDFSWNAFVYQRSTDQISLVSRASHAPQTRAGIGGTDPVLSTDGRFVAFTSRANNLVSGQDSLGPDVFLLDRVSGEMRLVSHTSASLVTGAGIPDYIGGPYLTVSADGRYVAFLSRATNLVPGQVDTHETDDLFVYDRVTGEVALITHVPGSPATASADANPLWPSFSADGRFLVFEKESRTQTPNGAVFSLNAFLHDQSSGVTVPVGRPPGGPAPDSPRAGEISPGISADGSVIVFHSTANHLEEGQVDLNGFEGLFLYHRPSGEITSPVYRDPGLPAVTANSRSMLGDLSADGRFVLFMSQAAGLVPGQASEPPDLPGDGPWHLFLRDRQAGTTTWVSRSSPLRLTFSSGLDPVLSADGRFAAFVTARDLTTGQGERLQLYDRTADTFTLVNHVPGSATEPATGSILSPSISADGRYLVYTCEECNPVPGYQPGEERTSDVFLYDRVTGVNRLVSHANGSTSLGGDGSSESPRISADGRFSLFTSTATNLVPGQIDSPDTLDLFVFDRTTGAIALVSHKASSATQAAGVEFPYLAGLGLSPNGRFIVFASRAPDLVPGQVNPSSGGIQLFLQDRMSGTTALVSHAAGSPVTVANNSSFPFGTTTSLQGYVISISTDGRFLVYQSYATDLVAGFAGTNDRPGVFLYDRLSGSNTAIRHSRANGSWSAHPSLNADGSRIAFLGFDTNSVAASGTLYVYDRSTSRTAPIGLVTTESSFSLSMDPPQISANGGQIGFTTAVPAVRGDFNGLYDVYLWSDGFVSLPNCKLLDTRRRTDRPVLTSNVQRTVAVRGACGVPATAKQVVVKVTVSNPSGKGNLRFYPGTVTATPSGILRFERNATRTETFTLPLSPNGTLTVLPFVAGKGTVHGVVEVTGYAN